MPDLSPSSAIPLSPDARERFERLVASEVARVRSGLADLELDSPLVAVAFLYTEDEDHPLVEYHYACTEETRRADFEDGDERGLWSVWGPPDWGLEDFMDEPSADDWSLGDEVAADLRAVGIEFATPTVLEEVCWRLSRAPVDDLPPRTDDFAVWVSEHEIDAEAHESFARTASAVAVQCYRERDWLRFPGDREAPSTPSLDGDDELAALADAIADRLEAALAGAGDGGPWPAMALYVTDDRATALVPSFKLCPPARRAQALALRARWERSDRMDTAWVADWWHPGHGTEDDDGWGDEIETAVDWPADLVRRSLDAFDRLSASGVEEPNLQLAAEACRRLNRRRTANTTADFVAFPWPAGERMLSDLTAIIHAVATPEVLASLVADDLLVADLRKLDALGS